MQIYLEIRLESSQQSSVIAMPRPLILDLQWVLAWVLMELQYKADIYLFV